MMNSTARHVLQTPEVGVGVYAFLVNFLWEFAQVPFYRCLETRRHGECVAACTRATFGDAGIAIAAYWTVAVVGSRRWIFQPTPMEVAGFVGTGVGITVVFEWLATEVLDRWAYSERMPVLPVLGTGLLPLLQWTLLPPLVVYLVRRRYAEPPRRYCRNKWYSRSALPVGWNRKNR
jgi:hypothetical protein